MDFYPELNAFFIINGMLDSDFILDCIDSPSKFAIKVRQWS